MTMLIISGYLSQDPEASVTAGGMAKAIINVAVNQANGKADFFRLTAFGKVAENVTKWKHKGDYVTVTGHLSNNTVEQQDGSKRTYTNLIADRVAFGPSKAKTAPAKPETAPEGEASEGQEQDETGAGDEAIPF